MQKRHTWKATGPLLQGRLCHYNHNETVQRIYFLKKIYIQRCFFLILLLFLLFCLLCGCIWKIRTNISIQHTDDFLFHTCPDFFSTAIFSQRIDHFLYCTCPNFFLTAQHKQGSSKDTIISVSFFFLHRQPDATCRALMKHSQKAVQLYMHSKGISTLLLDWYSWLVRTH